jgi:hypothetical protein
MDERTGGVTTEAVGEGEKNGAHSPSDVDPDVAARNLEEKADAIRDHLGDLVGELDRRRHRATPIAITAVVVAIAAGLVIGGAVMHRRRRLASSRLRNMASGWLGNVVPKSARKSVERLARSKNKAVAQPPSATNRILVAAGGTLASVLIRHFAQRLLSVGPPPGRPRTAT